MTKRTAVGIVLLLLGVTATVYGAQSLFTQIFPGVPATATVLTTSCASPASLVAAPIQVAPGSSGGVFFSCSTGPAFKVATDGAAIPQFTLAAPYTNVSIVQSSSVPTSGCSSTTGLQLLTSGTAFSFTGVNGGGNTYNYCVKYVNALSTGLPTFNVAWTQ